MKLILRTLIILAAAAIVSGIALAMVNASGGAQSALPGLSEGEGMRSGRNGMDAFSGEQRPEGFAEGGRFERHGLENDTGLLGFGMTGLARNLGIIAGIVAVYWLVEKLMALFRSKMKLNLHSSKG